MVQAGDVIGAYEIIEQLGVGGMATVYKAYHSRLDRYVAVKMLHANLNQEANFLSRFEREARIIARLEHPHIVTVYDFDEHDGVPYLVMKYVEGRTLEQVLRSEGVSLAQVVRIMTPIADALDYAHERDVLHRDVKPSNILLDTRRTPYLTDFGLAKLVRGGSSTLSQGTMIGTPYYISPEQALGQSEVDMRADVYSFGVVLYELTVGRVPFTGDTPISIVHDHIYTPPPRPREVNPALPQRVEDVLVRALSKDPAARYQDVATLMADFAQAINETAPSPVAADSVSHTPPRVEPVGGAALESTVDEPVVEPMAEESDPFGTPRRPSRGARRDRPGGRDRKTEFSFNLGDIERWGEQIEDRAEKFAESVEEWAEQFEGDNKRRKSKKNRSLSPEEQIRRRVEKRLKARQEFAIHLVAFVLVNLMLWMIWGLTGGFEHGLIDHFAWPVFVTLGWGIGMFAHMMEYHQKYGSGATRREKMIQKEIARARERGELPYADDEAIEAKRKHDDLADPRVRLADDGELSASFAEDMMVFEEKSKQDRV